MADAHHHDHDHDHSHDHDHAHDHDTAVATQEKPKLNQEVTTQDVGPARKSLTIVVPAERIAKAISENYGKLRDDAVLPGFRRGRAPQRLLEKRFGESVKQEVRNQIISESYSAAIEDLKLEVLGEPEVRDMRSLALPENGPFTFVVEVEVLPQFELPNFEGLALTRTPATVTDEQVENQVDQLTERYGKVSVIEGKSESEDYLQADIIVRAKDEPADAQPLRAGNDMWVHIPGEKRNFRGHVGGIIVDDLGRKLLGVATGDKITFEATGPATHEDEQIKNKALVFELTAKQINRLQRATVEHVAEQAGVASPEELRKDIREKLEQNIKAQEAAELRRQAGDILLQGVNMELPVGLSGRQTARILQRRAMELAYQGQTQDQIDSQLAELRTQSEVEAARQLKMFFILDKLAEKLGTEVSEGELNGNIALMAHRQGRRPEKVRQQMARSGEIEQLYLQLRDQKSLDAVVAKANVTDATK